MLIVSCISRRNSLSFRVSQQIEVKCRWVKFLVINSMVLYQLRISQLLHFNIFANCLFKFKAKCFSIFKASQYLSLQEREGPTQWMIYLQLANAENKNLKWQLIFSCVVLICKFRSAFCWNSASSWKLFVFLTNDKSGYKLEIEAPA